MRKIFIGGNWKCNNTLSHTQQMVTNIIDKLQFQHQKVDVIVAPVFLHLVTVLFTKKQEHVQVSAQNCAEGTFGAFTGEIAAEQIKDINVQWVIIGHSQRRTHYKQCDEGLSKKVSHAMKIGLKVIFCFGQTLPQRQEGKTMEVVQKQLDAVKGSVVNWENIVLAYEPVWAIGTGKNATKQQVNQVHDWIRKYLIDNIGGQLAEKVRIIYGGSVNQKNCQQLIQIKNVDGFLVGGASLKPQFIDIVNSAKSKYK